MTTDDTKLLRQYTEERAKLAFGELVTRHLDLVLSAALRVVAGDRHLAEDVTQTVFADLARKAGSLPRGVVLAGWLYRHTCFTAAKAVRAERRRQLREKSAMEMNALHDDTEPNWEQIAPVLDEAMNKLNASDRDAIVLRFLKRQDLRAVGAALGVGEDAAQKRVGRALEKLRTFMSRRGVALTAPVLASVLTAEAVTVAPAGLAVSVSATSLAGAAVGIGITATLMKFMATTKLKTGVASAIVVASVVTPLAVQHQAQARLRDQDEAVRDRTDRLSRLQEENERLANRFAQANKSSALSNEQFSELLRLRGEVGRLRMDVRELEQAKTNAAMSRTEMLASMANYYSGRVSQLKQMLETNPSEKIPELQFLTDDEWLILAGKVMPDTEEGHLRASEHQGEFPTNCDQAAPYFYEFQARANIRVHLRLHFLCFSSRVNLFSLKAKTAVFGLWLKSAFPVRGIHSRIRASSEPVFRETQPALLERRFRQVQPRRLARHPATASFARPVPESGAAPHRPIGSESKPS